MANLEKMNVRDENGNRIFISMLGMFEIPDLEKKYVMYSILNEDDSIDGILVQMPLPKHLNESEIQNTIDPFKDVDGLTFINAGRLVQGMPSLVPCTPKGIIDLLDEYKIKLEGSQVVVIGRSVLVGKPMAMLLLNKNAFTKYNFQTQNNTFPLK